MSLLKKIVFLLVFFLLLNVVSIYTFDYKSYFNTSETVSIQTDEKTESIFNNSISKIKNFLFDMSNSKTLENPFIMTLTKKDSIIEISGIFSNLDDVKKISDFLSVNKEGKLEFEDNRKIDEELLKKLSLLMPSFRDFFSNGTKLTVINNEIILEGTLLDMNHKSLFDSIVAQLGFTLKTNIIVPEKVSTEEIKEIVSEKAENKNPLIQKINKAEIQLEINKLLFENKITFERKSSNVTTESIKVIEHIAKILNENPAFKLEIAGHTDSRGKDSLNKQISQDRALSVANILISKGVDKQRVSAVGYGEEFPIAQDDENGLSEINRRVEFNILGE